MFYFVRKYFILSEFFILSSAAVQKEKVTQMFYFAAVSAISRQQF
jgi:hypothetical protein